MEFVYELFGRPLVYVSTEKNLDLILQGTYKKLELNSGDESSSKGDAHLSITKCGTSLSTLTLSRVNYDDCGRYRVKVQNLLGMDSHDCVLTVEGKSYTQHLLFLP